MKNGVGTKLFIYVHIYMILNLLSYGTKYMAIHGITGIIIRIPYCLYKKYINAENVEQFLDILYINRCPYVQFLKQTQFGLFSKSFEIRHLPFLEILF